MMFRFIFIYLSASLVFVQVKAQNTAFPNQILVKEHISSIKIYSECLICKPVIKPWLSDSIVVNEEGKIRQKFSYSVNGSLSTKKDYVYSNNNSISIETTVYPMDSTRFSTYTYLELFKYNDKGQCLKSLTENGGKYSLREYTYSKGLLKEERFLLLSENDLNQNFNSSKPTLSVETSTNSKIYNYLSDTTVVTTIQNTQVNKKTYLIECEKSIKAFEYDQNGVLTYTKESIKDDSGNILKIQGSSLMIFNIPGSEIGEFRPFKELYTYNRSGLLTRIEKYDNNQLSRIVSYEYYD